jgi:hypothetical protein
MWLTGILRMKIYVPTQNMCGFSTEYRTSVIQINNTLKKAWQMRKAAVLEEWALALAIPLLFGILLIL